jgi:NitT/TauT family transport system permease protein
MATARAVDEEIYVGAEDVRAPGPVRRFYVAHDKLILGGAAVFLFLAIWEWAGTSGAVNPLFSSSPTRIVRSFQLMAQTELMGNILTSGKQFLAGFALAILIGIPLGILMGWYRPLEGLLDPFVSFFYATPRIALLPLMIIWLGIGERPIVAVIFLGAFFAILINTIAGVKNLDASLLRAAHSFGASSFQIFRTIALPGSVPFIVSGIRLGLGSALVGIVVGELWGAKSGVGYSMFLAANTFQTDKVFVGVVIIAIAGLTFSALLGRVEDHFQSWKPSR